MTIDRPVCFDCKRHHEELGQFTCDAFLKGIPWEIKENGNKHATPLPGQKNNIVFEKIKEVNNGV